MTDHSWINRLGIQVTYFTIGMVVLILLTLPLGHFVQTYAAPDVMFALACALILRRPDAMTPTLIVVVTLLADFVLQRPPALWTLIVLSSVLLLKTRQTMLRESLFIIEWGTAAGAMALAFAVYFIALYVLFLSPQGLYVSTVQWVMTVLFYPIAVYFGGIISRIGQKRAIEPEQMGGKP